MSTFRWEVGFALGFVWPVYDQVPKATETVGDLIYKNEENSIEKQTSVSFSKQCKLTFMAGHVICKALYAEAHTVSIFSSGTSGLCMKREHTAPTSSLHWANLCCGNSLIIQAVQGTYCAHTLQCLFSGHLFGVLHILIERQYIDNL